MYILMAIFLIAPILAFPQKKNKFWLKQAIGAGACMTAGFFDGETEVLLHHYKLYKAKHPRTNPQWSNPALSFRNKYKNFPEDMRSKYFLSKSLLVAGTDKVHLNHAIRNMLLATNVTVSLTLYEKPNWKLVVMQGLISWTSYAIGSGIAHAYYGNPHKK